MSKIIYKNYTEEMALDLVKKRYENMEGRFPYTLAQLDNDKNFQAVFFKLKDKTYPDWAIYMAIVNTIINYKINNSTSRPTSPVEHHGLWKKHMDSIEREQDLIVPVGEFTEENLEFAIDLYVMSFLKGQGYELRRGTPNIKKLRKYAERNYELFAHDMPHAKWFKFENP